MRVFLKSMCLLAIMFFAVITVQAQEQQEVVYLKNGSIVKGVIIEQIPNSSLKTQTADGSIFAHVRSEFLDNSISPFFDFKIGYTVYDATGFYMTPSVGCRFALGERSGISVGLGYTMQKIEYDLWGYSGSENCGGFSIKVGFDF